VQELPRGTVTFLFTDVEGSTRLLLELGDAYADALSEHRRALRAAFTARGGVEVDTQGDAFFVAFSRASDALTAACEGQESLAGGPVRVRMGLHTGEPVVTDEGYVGMDVHKAARIAGAGHGGQVLVSQSTRDLAGGEGLRDLGEHRLKDLTAAERIWQLGDGEFPPLRSLNATNLPVAASPLVGREQELGDLVGLLSDNARLVTLTGTGGTGKTRLALQVGAELVEAFSGGVFFVPLSGLREAELVPKTIASTVGVREPTDLGGRDALLLIDNFEHLLDAAPRVADILSSGTRIKVLTTSRAPLRIEGEREYPLDPLPDDDAVELLTERARAVRPDFVPDRSARAICRRLDGLPLALELAASRLRSLDTITLLDRLDRRLPLLTGGRRDAPERQRTLRATIEWSYELLDPDLQTLFARLGVFATFSLEAAESVTDADVDGIDALVEASLLKPVGTGRFLMLETIREYALEQLEAGNGSDETHMRHACYLLELARRANLNIEAEGPMRHDLVLPERNNIRSALEWSVDTGRTQLGLELAVALENFWASTGDPFEGRRWLEALLAQQPVAPALHALAMRCLANCAVFIDGSAAGVAAYERALAEYRALGDELGVAIVRHRIAVNVAYLGDAERAGELCDESLAFFGKRGFKKGEAQCLTLSADLLRRGGSPAESLGLYERGIALCEETGYTWWEQGLRCSQGLALLALGRPGDAGDAAREALRLARSIDDRIGIVNALALVARSAVEQDDDELAGQLLGAVEAEDARRPIAGWSAHDPLWKPLLSGAGAGFEASRAAGRALSLDGAVARALQP